MGLTQTENDAFTSGDVADGKSNSWEAETINHIENNFASTSMYQDFRFPSTEDNTWVVGN